MDLALLTNEMRIMTRLCPYSSLLRSALILGFACCLLQPLSAGEPVIRTIAGTGSSDLTDLTQAISGVKANIGNPFGVEISPEGDLYICEVSHHRVWKFDFKRHTLSVVAGTGRKGRSGDWQRATEAELNEPYEVRITSDGDIYFVEMQNHLVRKIDHETGMLTTDKVWRLKSNFHTR